MGSERKGTAPRARARRKRSYAYAENQSDLARKLALSRQTLWKYERMDGFPARGRRGYPVEKVLAFILGKRREAEQGVGEDDELQALKKKQIIVSTKLDEIRLHRAEGKSLPRDVFEDEVSFLTDFFTGSYDTFVDRVAAETKDRKLVAIIERAVSEAKSDLADQLESMAQRFEEEARAADKAAGAPSDLAVGAEKRQPPA